jgi:hypothetical protein
LADSLQCLDNIAFSESELNAIEAILQ